MNGHDDLRNDMERRFGDMRADMERGFGGIRVEMHQGFGAIRTEMADRNAELLKWLLVYRCHADRSARRNHCATALSAIRCARVP